MSDLGPPPPPPPGRQQPPPPPGYEPAPRPRYDGTVTETRTTTGLVEKKGPPPPLMFFLGFLFGAIIGFAIGLVLWHKNSSAASVYFGAGLALVSTSLSGLRQL